MVGPHMIFNIALLVVKLCLQHNPNRRRRLVFSAFLLRDLTESVPAADSCGVDGRLRRWIPLLSFRLALDASSWLDDGTFASSTSE